MAAALNALPNELLSLITSHLDRPRDLLYLSLVDRRLSHFAKLDGWKALLKGRFALNGLESDARDAVHGLTTLYRNWNRKGFIARYLEPTEKVINLDTWRPQTFRGSQGQTMGYQPSIDSYEEHLGAWGERREVLVWSAGNQIILRLKEAGREIERIRKEESQRDPLPDQTWAYDTFNHVNSWYTYKMPNSFEGRDDITSLRLLRPHQRDMAFESVVFGTASGHLGQLSVAPDQCQISQKQFATGNMSVGSLSVSNSESPFLVASLGYTTLSLYPIDSNTPVDATAVDECSRVTPVFPGAQNGRIWSCQFLAEDQVAVGFGPSAGPVHVYKITPNGFLADPIRTFALQVRNSRFTSVYPLLPVPREAHAGSGSGNTFLSGGHDGMIRLHDVRSPRNVETIFWDPTNDSSVYSLAAQGAERVVAGVSRHSMIKVFDLRFPGSHVYNMTPTIPKPRKQSRVQDVIVNSIMESENHNIPVISGGWNLYLNPRQAPKRSAYRGDYWRGLADSPVYSLSIPSPTSPNLYTGLEGVVQSLTFHGMADFYPDTMLSHSVVRLPKTGAVDIKASYDLYDEALNLGMYEQGSEEGVGMQLLVQGDTVGYNLENQHAGMGNIRELDERWRDIRSEGNRWARGDIPPPIARGRGRGRARQGRGRGGS